MSTCTIDKLAHDITRITEEIRKENSRHSDKIMSLDIELAQIKLNIQIELGKMNDKGGTDGD